MPCHAFFARPLTCRAPVLLTRNLPHRPLPNLHVQALSVSLTRERATNRPSPRTRAPARKRRATMTTWRCPRAPVCPRLFLTLAFSTSARRISTTPTRIFLSPSRGFTRRRARQRLAVGPIQRLHDAMATRSCFSYRPDPVRVGEDPATGGRLALAACGAAVPRRSACSRRARRVARMARAWWLIVAPRRGTT